MRGCLRAWVNDHDLDSTSGRVRGELEAKGSWLGEHHSNIGTRHRGSRFWGWLGVSGVSDGGVPQRHRCFLWFIPTPFLANAWKIFTFQAFRRFMQVLLFQSKPI